MSEMVTGPGDFCYYSGNPIFSTLVIKENRANKKKRA